MVDVGIFGKVVDIFCPEESFGGHRAVFPVVVAEYVWGIAYLVLMVMQSVDKVLVFAIVIEQGTESPGLLEYAGWNHPKSSIDEWQGKDIV